MPSSYNGWPASPDKNEIGVVKFGDAQGFPFPGGVKSGDVFTVLGYVATQLHERVEPCIDGYCWGYTYKQNVNNPSQLSCHASATAIDWNAPLHGNGSAGTFTDEQVGTIYAILNEVEGAVDWLEGYDEMHFEIDVDANTLAKIAAKLPGGGSGPAPTPDPEIEDDMPRRIVTVYDSNLSAYAQAFDGPTGVVVLQNEDEMGCVQAVIDNDTMVNQAQIDVYNAVLARGNALTAS